MSRPWDGGRKEEDGGREAVVNAGLGVGEWKEALQAGGPCGLVVWEGREGDVTGGGIGCGTGFAGIVGWPNEPSWTVFNG